MSWIQNSWWIVTHRQIDKPHKYFYEYDKNNAWFEWQWKMFKWQPKLSISKCVCISMHFPWFGLDIWLSCYSVSALSRTSNQFQMFDHQKSWSNHFEVGILLFTLIIIFFLYCFISVQLRVPCTLEAYSFHFISFWISTKVCGLLFTKWKKTTIDAITASNSSFTYLNH